MFHKAWSRCVCVCLCLCVLGGSGSIKIISVFPYELLQSESEEKMQGA